MTGRDEERTRPGNRDTGRKTPDEKSRPDPERRKPDTKKPEPPRLRGFDDWASF